MVTTIDGQLATSLNSKFFDILDDRTIKDRPHSTPAPSNVKNGPVRLRRRRTKLLFKKTSAVSAAEKVALLWDFLKLPYKIRS